MCEQGKFPLHLRPSLGQMGKQFHAGAVKPEPERSLPHPLDKSNGCSGNEIVPTTLPYEL